MGSEKQMKVSKRFGFNLRPFKKVTLRQQKSMQKVQKNQTSKKKSLSLPGAPFLLLVLTF